MPSNAYWQIVEDDDDSVGACIIEGQDVYGLGDDCRLRNKGPFNFSGYDVITLEFDIKATVDSPADHCVLQIKGQDDASWTTIEDFKANTNGYEHRSYDLVNGEWGNWAKNNVFIRFRWVSNNTGVAEGVRLNDLVLQYGYYGTFGADQVFSWSSSTGVTQQTIDCSPWLAEGEGFYFEFNYNTNGYAWLWWWAIDEVLVYDPTHDLLETETFDAWPLDGWWQDRHGQDGRWERDTDHPPANGANAQCDSNDHSTWTYNASLFTPTMHCTDENVTLEFWSNYENFNGWDRAKLNILHATSILSEFSDDFEGDLSKWIVTDKGSDNLDVTPTSLGKIKIMHR